MLVPPVVPAITTRMFRSWKLRARRTASSREGGAPTTAAIPGMLPSTSFTPWLRRMESPVGPSQMPVCGGPSRCLIASIASAAISVARPAASACSRVGAVTPSGGSMARQVLSAASSWPSVSILRPVRA